MSKVKIVACGLSNKTLTRAGQEALAEASMLIGPKRLVEEFCLPGVKSHIAFQPEVVAPLIEGREENIVLLVSGDAGFYSAAKQYLNYFKELDIEVIPGISSLNYFFAKLGRPWEKVELVSCHGKEVNLVEKVRRNPEVFALTGANVGQLLRELDYYGFSDCKVNVGENLGLPDEAVYSGTVRSLMERDYPSLTVLLIENPHASSRLSFGLPDEAFIRGEVPMTKSEIRAVIMSKLHIEPDSICLDLGAGTGSVSVEMALNAHEGQVLAIDRNAEAVDLIKTNAKNFQVSNLKTMHADLAEALDLLEEAGAFSNVDRVFIGGGGAKLIPELLAKVWKRYPQARVVGSAICLESLEAFMHAFKEAGAKFDVVQLFVARAEKLASIHMLRGENPIFILSGGLE